MCISLLEWSETTRHLVQLINYEFINRRYVRNTRQRNNQINVMGTCLGKNSEGNNDDSAQITRSTSSPCSRCSSNNDTCHCHPCPCFRWGKREGLIDVTPGDGSSTGQHRHGSVSPDSRISDPNFIVSITPKVVDDLVIQTLLLLRTLVGKWVHNVRP